MKTIPVGKFHAIVDDDLFEELSRHKWHPLSKPRGAVYAGRNKCLPDGSWYKAQMHREVLGLAPGDGVFCDHINGNGLDNRRENLRRATPQQNAHNIRSSYNQKRGGFVGVHLFKRVGKWTAYYTQPNPAGTGRGKRVHLGYFNSAEEAARARDKAILAAHGSFAAPNF